MRHDTWLCVALAAVLSAVTYAQRPNAAVCTYSLSYNTLSVPPSGASRSVDILTSASCGWSAASDVSWIAIIAGTSGTGPGTVNFSVIANPVNSSRVGHLTVQGQVLTITQVAVLGPTAQVQQVWMSRAQVPSTVNTLSCNPAPSVATTFSPTDPAAYVFLLVTQVSAGDVISSQYYTPAGALYANAGGSYTVLPDIQSVCLEDPGIKIVGAPPASMPGVWSVNVMVNGVLVVTASFTILGASNCSYTVSPTSLSVPPAGGNGYSVSVTTTASCAWTAVTTVPWITVTANSSGTGSGTAVFTVLPNFGDSRTGTLNMAGQAVAVTQIATGGPLEQVTEIWMTHVPFPNSITPCNDAAAAATTFAPTDAAAYVYLSITHVTPGDVVSAQYYAPDGSLYSAAGGSVTVPGMTPFGCWEDPGLLIRGTQAANLTGVWTVKVLVNRVLVITTAFTMLGGTNCAYALDSTSASFGAAGGTGTVAVTTSPGCSWTASTNETWIHVTSGATGTGGGSAGYSVDVNSKDTRTGVLLIAGQTFTVTEASGLPTLPSISPGGVADPWTYTKGVSPGAWISIYGLNLANTIQTWSPTPGQALATTLGGVNVTVDGILAAPSYVSPGLVNVLVPAAVRLGAIQIVVANNGVASLPYPLQSTKFLPAIYSNPAPGSSPPRYYVTAIDPFTNQLVGNLSADPRVVRAPRAGDTIDLYALGLGPAAQFPTDVSFTGAFPLASPVSVVLGGLSLTPSFAALVAPGLYQMRISIPATLAPGDQPLLLDLGGIQSAQNVFLSIQR